MFESDDFDQVLSQFDFPEVIPKLKSPEKQNECIQFKDNVQRNRNHSKLETNLLSHSINENNNIKDVFTISPKHVKRKIITSYFDHKSKRKFPGPAGILSGNIQEPKDENICQIELLSQDIDFTQNNLQRELFESPLWNRLQADLIKWNIHSLDSIKQIKQQAVIGNARRRKAQIITAFIEAVDRSVIDPLVILRDTTGSIKCTLHRDVWSKFSPYIVAEYCALVLCKPTILTTGSAFKKHYLNITQNNILGIYSSALLKDEENSKGFSIPDGCVIEYEEDFTVIKAELPLQNTDSVGEPSGVNFSDNDIFDDLETIFLEETF